MRFVFTPPADHAAGLSTLPWSEPLAEWRDERWSRSGSGASPGTWSARLRRRHPVRPQGAERAAGAARIPAAQGAGRTRHPGRGGGRRRGRQERARTGRPGRDPGYQVPQLCGHLPGRLLQPPGPAADRRAARRAGRAAGPAAPSGFFWGDCSLSNTLFRHDAGTLEAYLVDAETSEQHPELTDGQRQWDVELAIERFYGELLDLQAGELPRTTWSRWRSPRSSRAGTSRCGRS